MFALASLSYLADWPNCELISESDHVRLIILERADDYRKDMTGKSSCVAVLAVRVKVLNVSSLLVPLSAPGERGAGQPRGVPARPQGGRQAAGLGRLGPPGAGVRLEEAAAAGGASIPH